MPIVRHKIGGMVSFLEGGQRVNAGPGFTGDVPQRILDRFKKRFEVIDEPFPRMTADVKRDEVLTRDPEKKEPAREAKLGVFLSRHRGKGLWAVTETESGKVVSELMLRPEAEKLAEEMNAK